MRIFELDLFGFTIAPSYYGLMYVLGFIGGYMILKKRKFFKPADLEDLFLYIFLGVILGGRLGYMLFYGFDQILQSPLNILKVWEGGMSFHGGVIGVVGAMMIFSKRKKISFLSVADQVCLVLPIGLGLGRLGNYLNGELLGYSGYTGLFAVVQNNISYFPSALLEMLLEGVVLYIILYSLYKFASLNKGQVASSFLIFYGLFRIIVEVFFRTPDAHIGLIGGIASMGTILSIPMVIIGIFCFIYFNKK